MKKLLIIIIFFIVQLGFAQLTIKKSSIDSGGILSQNGNTTILYTFGELNVAEKTNTNISISEGFINPQMLQSLQVADYGILTGISIYPNPTVDYVILSFTEINTYDISIFDVNGKQLISKTIDADNCKLDFANFKRSVYVLLIKNKSGKLYKTFKIIKR